MTDQPLSTDPTATLAQTTLAELLAKMAVTATVQATWSVADDPDDGTRPLILDVQGDDLGLLIGRNGETLTALQYILRLMLNRQIEPEVSIVVDVQGHKRRREEQLRRLAQKMAEQVVQRHRTLSLEPMPAHERRIIHLELRNHPQVRTESTGDGSHRKVTIVPKD